MFAERKDPLLSCMTGLIPWKSMAMSCPKEIYIVALSTCLETELAFNRELLTSEVEFTAGVGGDMSLK
jgi:hypothetical protein